ncbi:hypothetical protein BGZ65_005779 [Modicella reniformis]|uniref:Uncharacterized protein n=1 Tax=Modicella reniformis TaxID=1440133 RepID=A0A9P6IXJ7_9FUNG|nr:hypothetical protein BGZ65_005779 [Modicella reniformis]
MPQTTSKEEFSSGLVFTQQYWDLILANRKLRRPCLLQKASLQWTVRSNKFIYDLLRGMKELKELAVDIVDMTLLWKLQELALTVEISPIIQSFVSNSHLSIEDVLVVLSQLPNLEYLNLTGIKHSDPIIQGSWLPVIPATFTSLEQESTLARLDIDNAGDLVPLLCYLPNLKALKIASLLDEVFEVLAASCKILESLECMYSRSFISEYSSERDILHKFLVSCFLFKSQGVSGIQRFINTDDMIREPWMVTYIDVMAKGSEDDDDDNGGDGDISEAVSELSADEQAIVQKFRRCQEQHRQARLGSGVYAYEYMQRAAEYMRYGSILDTLELTLESGVDRLGALRNLGLFGFEGGGSPDDEERNRVDGKELA